MTKIEPLSFNAGGDPEYLDILERLGKARGAFLAVNSEMNEYYAKCFAGLAEGNCLVSPDKTEFIFNTHIAFGYGGKNVTVTGLRVCLEYFPDTGEHIAHKSADITDVLKQEVYRNDEAVQLLLERARKRFPYKPTNPPNYKNRQVISRLKELNLLKEDT